MITASQKSRFWPKVSTVILLLLLQSITPQDMSYEVKFAEHLASYERCIKSRAEAAATANEAVTKYQAMIDSNTERATQVDAAVEGCRKRLKWPQNQLANAVMKLQQCLKER